MLGKLRPKSYYTPSWPHADKTVSYLAEDNVAAFAQAHDAAYPSRYCLRPSLGQHQQTKLQLAVFIVFEWGDDITRESTRML